MFSRLQRSVSEYWERRATRRKVNRYLREARRRRDRADSDLQERHRAGSSLIGIEAAFLEYDAANEELAVHESTELMATATRLKVPTMQFKHGRFWAKTTQGLPYLTDEAFELLLGRVRESKKERREAFQLLIGLLATVAGVLAGATGLAAVLINR